MVISRKFSLERFTKSHHFILKKLKLSTSEGANPPLAPPAAYKYSQMPRILALVLHSPPPKEYNISTPLSNTHTKNLELVADWFW